MEHHPRATVAYDGTDFSGFQAQGRLGAVHPPDELHPPRTVQSVLEDALAEVSRERVHLLAAGRTDAGVHALGQVVAFKIHWRHSLADLHRAWNAILPDDVTILSLCQAPQGFHPRFDATSRAYRYMIWNHPMRNPLFRRTALWVPESLDVASMGAAVELLVGEHDFATFGTVPGRPRMAGTGRVAACSEGQGQCGAHAAASAITDRVRPAHRVYRGTLRRVVRASCGLAKSYTDKDSLGTDVFHRPDGLSPIVYLDIEADAFLYRMVRSIVGTILQVGRGQISVAQFASLFAAADRSQAGPTAPPHGLCLMAVNYSRPVALC